MQSVLAPKKFIALAVSALALALSASTFAAGSMLKLSGDQEVPPVTSMASGTGTINIATDGAVSGSVTTAGITATMAHIHMAPGKGANGPVIVPLTQSSPGMWAVPAGAKLTPEQLKAYQDGLLYVNVHSAEHKAGEIRGALMP
jgi:hypothetical protein